MTDHDGFGRLVQQVMHGIQEVIHFLLINKQRLRFCVCV